MLGFHVAIMVATSPAQAGANSGASADYARQVSTVSLRMAEVEQILVEAEQRIEQLEEVIRHQGRSEATRLENIDEVNIEVARLRGEIEVLAFRLDEFTKTAAADQLSRERRMLHSEARLRQLEKFLGVIAPSPPTDAEMGLEGAQDTVPVPGDIANRAGDPGDAPPEVEVPDTAAGKLEIAVKNMEEGRQGVARAILKKAIDDHVGAEEMAEIRYRHAETYINEEKWRNAILQFQKVIDNHPDAEFKCWAHYRQGEAMEAFQGLQKARAFYAGATQGKCKASDAGKAAKKKL